MENFLEKIKELQIVTVGVILAVAILFSVKIVSKSLSQNVITVTGSAYEIVKSDSGVLEFEIVTNAPTKAQGYKELQKDLGIVKNYLEKKKITSIEAKTINGYSNFKRNANGIETNEIESYHLSQNVKIQSNNVELIKEISTDISSLVNEGVDMNVYPANYSYSKLGDLKVKLLEKASTDAKNRATSMLKPTHNRVGRIQSVRMGVYQITPVDSTDVSDNGISDTSTIDKKVTAVATVAFKIK